MTFCEFIEATTRLAYYSLIEVDKPEVKRDIRVEIGASDVAGAIPWIVELFKQTLNLKTRASTKVDASKQSKTDRRASMQKSPRPSSIVRGKNF
jgi:hypothetical protein